MDTVAETSVYAWSRTSDGRYCLYGVPVYTSDSRRPPVVDQLSAEELVAATRSAPRPGPDGPRVKHKHWNVSGLNYGRLKNLRVENNFAVADIVNLRPLMFREIAVTDGTPKRSPEVDTETGALLALAFMGDEEGQINFPPITVEMTDLERAVLEDDVQRDTAVRLSREQDEVDTDNKISPDLLTAIRSVVEDMLQDKFANMAANQASGGEGLETDKDAEDLAEDKDTEDLEADKDTEDLEDDTETEEMQQSPSAEVIKLAQQVASMEAQSFIKEMDSALDKAVDARFYGADVKRELVQMAREHILAASSKEERATRLEFCAKAYSVQQPPKGRLPETTQNQTEVDSDDPVIRMAKRSVEDFHKRGYTSVTLDDRIAFYRRNPNEIKL